MTIGPEIWYHRIERRTRPVTNILSAERTNTLDALKVYKDDSLVVGVSIRDLPQDRSQYFPVVASSGQELVEFGEGTETARGWEWRVNFRKMGSTRVEAYLGTPTGPTNWVRQVTIYGDLVDYKNALDRTSDLVTADIMGATANVNEASSAYKAAYDAQKAVLDAEAGRRKMVEDMMWNALFAGLGGIVGGGIGARMGAGLGRELRETFKGGAAIDAVKDVAKSLTKSAVAMGKPASSIEGHQLKPVTVSPFDFLTKWQAAAQQEGAYLLRQLAHMKELAGQAENEATQFETTEDPYPILVADPGIRFLREPLSTDVRGYSRALWEQWLGEYGYEFIDEHWQAHPNPYGGPDGHVEKAMIGTGVGKGSKLEDAIFAAAHDMGMSDQEARAWYEKARQPALERAQRQLAERQAGREPPPHVPGQPDAPRVPATRAP